MNTKRILKTELEVIGGAFGIGMMQYVIFGRSLVGHLFGFPASIAWSLYCVYNNATPEEQAIMRDMYTDVKEDVKTRLDGLRVRTGSATGLW